MNLYQILKYIDAYCRNIKEAKEYTNMIRAQLTAYAGTIRTASRFTSGHSAGVDSDS
ncbi:MAG: hypothetical protein KA288_09405 [Paludibacteraceae bacterium]|nr:hypothetical protein [Paludibacteraceae bacterium]